MKNESWRWHLHFGHLNFSDLKLLSTSGIVRDLSIIDPLSHICEVCIIDKQARLSFPSENSWRAEAPLHLVHTNICVPLDPVSLGGNRYFITFIDDFSRKLWGTFLKKNLLSLITFKRFKALIETESGHKLITLRFDWGGVSQICSKNTVMSKE